MNSSPRFWVQLSLIFSFKNYPTENFEGWEEEEDEEEYKEEE